MHTMTLLIWITNYNYLVEEHQWQWDNISKNKTLIVIVIATDCTNSFGMQLKAIVITESNNLTCMFVWRRIKREDNIFLMKSLYYTYFWLIVLVYLITIAFIKTPFGCKLWQLETAQNLFERSCFQQDLDSSLSTLNILGSEFRSCFNFFYTNCSFGWRVYQLKVCDKDQQYR